MNDDKTDTMTAPDIIAMIGRGAEQLVTEVNAGRTLTENAREDAYVRTCEVLLSTFIEKMADHHGREAASRLANTLHEYLDAIAARR